MKKLIVPGILVAVAAYATNKFVKSAALSTAGWMLLRKGKAASAAKA